MAEKKVIQKNSKKEITNFIGLLPLGVDAKHEFKPKYFDRLPKEYRAIFFLKPLNNRLKREWLRVIKLIYLEGIAEISGIQTSLDEFKNYDDKEEFELREIIRKSIIGWEGLKNSKGESIPFEKGDDGFLDEELFASLPDTLIGEFTEELNIISCLKDPELLGLG